MTNEFTAYCSLYYELTMLYAAQHEQLKSLEDNAPLYQGQTRSSEIDAIMSYYRGAQAEKAKMDKTFADMQKTKQTILEIMRHFEIPPRKALTGEIPGELEYEVWAYGDDKLFIEKIRDLEPEPVDPNVMVIKLSGF